MFQRKNFARSGWIVLGAAMFSLGFALFLEPYHINAGGISALAQLAVHLTGLGSVGLGVLILNVPLFILGWRSLGKSFFRGSVLGMLTASVLLDVFSKLPAITTEPLLAALCGGALCGFGLGIVFCCRASTGGSDILGRLLRRKLRGASMGTVMLGIDLGIVALTGIIYRDLSRALYSALSLYVSSQVIDGVIFRFDDSKLALVISDRYEEVAKVIDERLHRGVTLLKAQGYYARKDKYVLLCALRRQQLTQLQDTVMSTDPNAFLILQQAHQVLGDGFRRYGTEL